MHHSATQDLYPTGALADSAACPLTEYAANIYLSGWLGKREIAGAKADGKIINIEESPTKIDNASLEVAHVGGLVHHQAFDLMKHRRMGSVIIATIGAARHDNANRWFRRHHSTNLNG